MRSARESPSGVAAGEESNPLETTVRRWDVPDPYEVAIGELLIDGLIELAVVMDEADILEETSWIVGLDWFSTSARSPQCDSSASTSFVTAFGTSITELVGEEFEEAPGTVSRGITFSKLILLPSENFECLVQRFGVSYRSYWVGYWSSTKRGGGARGSAQVVGWLCASLLLFDTLFGAL